MQDAQLWLLPGKGRTLARRRNECGKHPAGVDSYFCRGRALLLVALFSACALPRTVRAAGAQCSPDDILALAKAGYSKQEVDTICRTSASFFGRSARVDLNAGAMTRFIKSVTPLEIDRPDSPPANGKLVLRDLKYCKASGEHQAELLGFGDAGSTGTGEPLPSFFEDADCSRPFSAVSGRLKNISGAARAFVARLGLIWVPWELRLRVLEMAGSGGGALPPAAVFPTNIIPVAVGKQTVPLSAAFYFSTDGIAVVLVPSADVAAISDAGSIPKLTAFSGPVDARTMADVSVRVTHKAVNYFVDTYFAGDQVIDIDTGIPSLGTLTMRQLHGEPTGPNSYSVSGVVSDSRGTSFLAKVVAQGADLAFDAVEIRPQSLTACPPLSFNPDTVKCYAANAALEAAARVVASGVTAAYRGRLLRTLGRPDTFRLTLGKLACDISGVVTYVTVTDQLLRADGSVSFRHP